VRRFSDNAIIVNGGASRTLLGKYAVIGGLAAIHQFIHIGDHAMILVDLWYEKMFPPQKQQKSLCPMLE
jgi:UDP-N-acetylglucosamine acyltransferase